MRWWKMPRILMRKLNLNQVNGNGCGFITILNLAQFPVIFSNLILAPPVISLDDLSASVLTEIVKIFQPKFNDDVFSLIRMKTIFPFVKGTEYEMSLETMDELLIVKLVSKSEKEPTEDRVKERWSSMVDERHNVFEIRQNIKTKNRPHPAHDAVRTGRRQDGYNDPASPQRAARP